jgi:urate oxidase
MTVEITHHAYGKTGVRLLRLAREEGRHEVLETMVEVRLEGDFLEAYLEGDNARVLPTDTMKNTVYALARELSFDSIEAFGWQLARHFLGSQPQVSKVTIFLEERPWHRLGDDGFAFTGGGEERYHATVTADREGTTISSGVRNLLIMKTTRSAFQGFPRDRFTTLKETGDRIFATRLEATWQYGQGILGEDGGVEALDFGAVRRRLLDAMLAIFADHFSNSVQQSLWEMGRAALETIDVIDEIHLVMPNKHYLVVDLGAFDLDNPNTIFLPTDDPAGRIEGTLRRG